MHSALPQRNLAELADRIAQFLSRTARDLGRDGAVLGLSGGLDSTTTAALCVRALGKDRVLALIMPEKEGAADVVPDGLRAADWLGIRREVVDITAQLDALGAYTSPLSRLPNRQLRALAVRAVHGGLQALFGMESLIQFAGGTRGKIAAAVVAQMRARHRVRMVTVALRAETENLLLVGCANRTEKLTGLFVKFGVDHCADVMPIAPLYRTEVHALARHLGVPAQILDKPPDPGIVPGAEDKYRFFLGLAADVVDEVLAGLNAGAAPADIAARLDLPFDKVDQLRRLVAASSHMRHPSMEPDLP